MAIYVEVNSVKYPASITGRLNDNDWNNRASKSITLEMSYEDAIKLFVDDLEWNIVQDIDDFETRINENGEEVLVPVTRTESYDNSEYSIAGDIIDHRDGTVTVKMGKPTAEELLALIEEAL